MCGTPCCALCRKRVYLAGTVRTVRSQISREISGILGSRILADSQEKFLEMYRRGNAPTLWIVCAGLPKTLQGPKRTDGDPAAPALGSKFAAGGCRWLEGGLR